MPSFQAPRGMRDLLPEEAAAFDALQAVIEARALRYGYPRIAPPIVEDRGVFTQSGGAGSGGYGGGDTRLPRARPAPRATTGALLLLRADVPRAAAAAPPLPPVLAMGPRVLRSRGGTRRRRDHRLHRAPLCGGRSSFVRARTEHDRRREVPAKGEGGARVVLREEPRRAVGRVQGATRAEPAAHPRFEGPEGSGARRGGAAGARAPLRRGSRAFRSGHRRRRTPRPSL